jgi:hypothetical protein
LMRAWWVAWALVILAIVLIAAAALGLLPT